MILGGHSHTLLDEQEWVGGVLIAQAGAGGEALGRVDVLMRPEPDGGGFRVAGINGQGGRWWGHDDEPLPATQRPAHARYPRQPLIRSDTSVPPAGVVTYAYEPYRSAVERHLQEPLATLAEPIPGGDPRASETPMGNLLADAIRWNTDADAAVYAATQFGPGTLPAGTVDRTHLYGLIGAYTRQHLVTVSTPGRWLRQMVQNAADDQGRVTLYLSGVEAEPVPRLDSGEAVDDARRYRVAGAAHVMQDHLIGRAGVRVLDDSPRQPIGREALALYLEHLGEVPVPETGRLGVEAAAAVPAR